MKYPFQGLKQEGRHLASQFRKTQTRITPAKLAPDWFDRLLCGGAAMLFVALCIAVIRGQKDWPQIPLAVWFHIGTVAIALVLTPVMLLRKRGDKWHRQLGWLWVTSMLVTAIISLDIRLINRGSFSIIHLLSASTLIQCAIILWSARSHNVARHRGAVRGMVLGALLIAGFFTFPFDRLLGQWLFG